MVFKFLCITVGKYCKLPLGIQRPTVKNELISPGLLCSNLTYCAFEQCSKILPIMLNIMPITTAIMPQFIYNFIISMTRLA